MKRLLLPIALVGAIGAVLYFVVFQPRPVRSISLARGVVVHEALGSGSVESRRVVGVGFEVTARVDSLLVDQGDLVKQGQELARLDDRTFRAEVDFARQELALSTSTLMRLNADIARAEAVLEGARNRLKRTVPLVKQGTASAEKLDVDEEREKVAVAELAKAKAALAEGKASTSVAQGRLDRAQVELERTVLYSPFDGAVLVREREVGDVAVPGSSVLRLAATDTIWSSVWVDESHLHGLRVGLPTRVVLRSAPGTELAGQVARIGREVDRETRELLVDIAFESLPDNLVFGQRVDVWIELSRAEDVVRVPAAWIVRNGQTEGVFVERKGRAHFRKVELGITGRGFYAVAGGLEPGQRILQPRAGKLELKEGTRVELLDSQPASAGGTQ